MLEEKIVELTEAIKELTLWVKSNDSTPVEKPVEKEPKTRKRRTKKEIESEKKLTEIEDEEPANSAEKEYRMTKAEVSTPTAREVTYDMVKNAAKALVNIGPGGPGLAKAAAIRDSYGYAQLSDIEPKDYPAMYKALEEAVKTWGK